MTRARVGGPAVARSDLARYWLGQTTSAFGSVFTAIALPIVAVVRLGASPGEVAMISVASVLPALLFGLPAGALADRIVRPRRTLMALDLVSALAVGAVAAGLAGHVASLGWLVALGLVEGCVSILVEVVYFVHLRQLTGAAGVGVARARLQAGEFAAGFVGRLLAGPAIVAFGSPAALAVDAVSYLLSATALATMRPLAPAPREPRSAPLSTLRGAAGGLGVFVGDRFRRSLLIFILAPAAALAGGGAITGPFLLRVAHVPASAYGLAFALSGLMGLAGSALAGRLLRTRRNPRLVVLAGFAAAMASSLLLPLSTGPLPVELSGAALGIGLPVFFGAIANVGLSAVFAADIPEASMGRALAAVQVFAAAAALLGALAGGVLGDWLGTREALWILDVGALGVIAVLLPSAVRAGQRLSRAPVSAPG